MRRNTLFAWGIGGLLAGTTPGFAQPPLPGLPTAAAPVPPSAHEWYVKPVHGKWMICVKSYSGPLAKTMAEELVRDIRTAYKVPAYLYERGTEARKQQDEFVTREKERQKAEQAQFLALTDKLRDEALAKGQEFVESRPTIKVPRQNIEDQWAVLIGGWPDSTTARKQLDIVRTWPAPKNQKLMDTALIGRGSGNGEMTYVNPFQLGLVVPNPSAPPSIEDDGMDKVLFQLNKDEPLSVYKAKKPWTLVVKSFHPPRRRLDDHEAKKSVMQKLFGSNDGQEMQAMANQANEFAKAMRHPNFKPHPVETYLFHTVYGTLVCAGEFDAPDDPKMAQLKQDLESVTYSMKRADSLQETKASLFDPTMFAFQVPKQPGK